MSSTNFFRTYVDDRSFIRGAARLLIAPITASFPTEISNVIALAAVSSPQDDVQTISMTGPPTSGNFQVTLDEVQSANIAWDATAAAVQTALTGMSNIGTGNVTCTGGPLPGAAVVCTFGGALADQYVDLMTTQNALAGGTASVAHTTPGQPTLNLYDAQPGWTDLGATKNGISIAINNAEETFDIDQQLGIIGSQPSSWTVTVSTSLAESTPERMQIAWEGSAITLDTTPPSGPEQEIGFGAPNYYIQRRLAVLYQRPSGLIRGYFFRIAQRSPAESTLTHNKTGDQQSIPVTFNILADNTVTNVLQQFFIIRDQATPSNP